MNHLVIPDYYENFECKQSGCRSNCCHDWLVTITENEYFRLLGLACGKRLRTALDVSLHRLPNPDKECFAEFSRKADGTCPCETKEGLCGLQLKMGEKVLPMVCRTYPRCIEDRIAYLSNSCEKVVEMLLSRKAPVEYNGWDETYCPNKRKAIEILQGRSLSTEEALQHILKEFDEDSRLLKINNLDPETGLKFVRRFLKRIGENSESISKYSAVVLSVLKGDDAVISFSEKKREFQKIIPDADTYFGSLLVNYILSVENSEEDPSRMASMVCIAYTLLKVICVCHTAAEGTLSSFVDTAAGSFRFIQHNQMFEHSVNIFSMVTETIEKEKNACLTQEK